MKNRIISIILIILFVFTNTKAQNMEFYKTKWKKVEKNEKDGLPKSALKLVNEIIRQAEIDKNSEQTIKSFIYRVKYQTEEEAYEELCYELDSTAKQASFPDNAIMYSMLADMYYWYLNNYNYSNQSNIINFDNDDMQTWSIYDFVKKINENYKLSLENVEGLRKINVTKYKELVEFGSKPDNLRPTLYDFLIHKAIDFYSNTSISLTKPKDYFQLKEDFYFSNSENFILQDITTSDTLSLHYNAQLYLQDLLKFRLFDKNNTDALIDADLKRLKFAYTYSVNDNKDDLFLKALKKLELKYKNIAFSAEISYLIAHFYYKLSHQYEVLEKNTEKYKFYKKTAYDICTKTVNKYPQQNAAEYCNKLKNSLKTHNLSFNIENIITPNKQFYAKILYQNINKVFIRIAKIDYDKYNKLKNKYSYDKLYKKVKKHSTEIFEINQDLPIDKDLNHHSTEIILPKIPVGFYVLFVSNNKEHKYNKALASYQVFKVSNISYIKQNLYDGSNKYVVFNRTTGAPMQDVNCQIFYDKYGHEYDVNFNKTSGVFKTGEDGKFVVETKSLQNSGNAYVNFSIKDDFLSTDNNYYTKYHEEIEDSEVNTLLFTDRAIYRPGQTVYFKGFAIRTDGEKNKIETNYKLKVFLKDVNRANVAELELITNEYGTFSGTFHIPKGLLNGNFSLECNNVSKNILIEEYKRPKFEIEMLPFNGNYLLNDEVEVNGKAISYAGAAINNATVNYHIFRTAKWSGWWNMNHNTSQVEIKSGEIKTDNSGNFKIKFEAIPDLSYKENEFLSFNYIIKVSVTDINGEMQNINRTINIGYRALQVSLPLSGLINKNKIQDNIEIGAFNFNYEKINAKGKIKIFKLKDLHQAIRLRYWTRPDKHIFTKEEWYKNFPGNIYDNENEFIQSEKEKLVLNTNFDTKNQRKLDFSIIKNFDTGKYVAEIYSTDFFGNKVSNKHFFNIISDKDKKMPYKKINLFYKIHSYCEPGEDAQFLIGSSNDSVSVLYEIEHKGKIVSSKFIQLNNEQKLIKIPVKEKHRGNFSVNFVFVKNNRFYNNNAVIYVPYSNKKLNLEFETFRDKLHPNEKEQWRIKIKGNKGDKVAAEMLATLYDASLDGFKQNNWSFDIYKSFFTEKIWKTNTFTYANAISLKHNLDPTATAKKLTYNNFNWFGFNGPFNVFNMPLSDLMNIQLTTTSISRKFKVRQAKKSTFSYLPIIEETENSTNIDDIDFEIEKKVVGYNIPRYKNDNSNFTGIKIRSNFNETAFFYPHLRTNKEGEIIVEFTIPEALTKWKMMGFASTKDLQFGKITNELITQKDLMLVPNAPRFFRENDKIKFPVKISNISDKNLSGKVKLEFFDAITMKPIKNIFAENEESTKQFTIKAQQSNLVSWKLEIPKNISAIMYKVIANANNFSDGEQKVIPVLTNKILITEAIPLSISNKQTKTYKFNNLINSNKSKTIKHHRLTLEFTSNPVWYAIQALTYLIEYPYECSEQTFSRFYANTIAAQIVNSNPKIKKVFDSWKNIKNSEALLSNLEKNQELKAILLEETPWVLNGKNESERKKQIALLFDLNKVKHALKKTLKKLIKSQTSNGGWPWFTGMPDSRTITQHIVAGFGHLYELGIEDVVNNETVRFMIKKAIGYIDAEIFNEYSFVRKNYKNNKFDKNHLSNSAIQYLYARSYFPDIKITKRSKIALEYYKKQAEKYWFMQNKYMQGMIALFLHKFDNKAVALNIVKSLKEHSINDKETGMYWKDNTGGYYWYQAQIEQQALMIEVFDKVAQDTQAVTDLKIWLLKQKQTHAWKTTKATTEAVYALLMHGKNWILNDKPIEVKIGNKILDSVKMKDVKIEAGTGYFKTSWNNVDIKPKMGNITVKKIDEGTSYGAVYWQYFELFNKITTPETPLKIEKQLFIEKFSENGIVLYPITTKNQLKIGDKVIVRIELNVDKAMEYVHMKDMRASCFEPINVISEYKWKVGLHYYESTKDAATNFFIETLPKGTYLFEYPLKVTHEGEFSNGITTIQCMYAPEFTSHSKEIRIKVK